MVAVERGDAAVGILGGDVGILAALCDLPAAVFTDHEFHGPGIAGGLAAGKRFFERNGVEIADDHGVRRHFGALAGVGEGCHGVIEHSALGRLPGVGIACAGGFVCDEFVVAVDISEDSIFEQAFEIAAVHALFRSFPADHSVALLAVETDVGRFGRFVDAGVS